MSTASSLPDSWGQCKRYTLFMPALHTLHTGVGAELQLEPCGGPSLLNEGSIRKETQRKALSLSGGACCN